MNSRPIVSKEDTHKFQKHELGWLSFTVDKAMRKTAMDKDKRQEKPMNLQRYLRGLDQEADEAADQIREDAATANPNAPGATSTGDIRGVSADQAPHVDWSSGKGPETDLGKRALKKKSKIVRRRLNAAALMNDPSKT